jgi:hypothetical protein
VEHALHVVVVFAGEELNRAVCAIDILLDPLLSVAIPAG